MTDDDWKPRFLAILAEGSTVEMAARAVGIHRATAYRHRREDKQLAEQWDLAIESGTDMLEETAIMRAREYSDPLLLALLKARRPDVYTERHRLEHTRVDFKEAQNELERMALKMLQGQAEDDEEEQPKRLPKC